MNDKHFVITIERQYGSGGRLTGKRLAEELGIHFYDEEILKMTSETSAIGEQYFRLAELLGLQGNTAAPINVLELFIRPLSLCMRLFGNVLGAIVVMALIKHLLPLIVPLPFSFYFDIFDGVIQAYVFVFLTSLYIKEAIED